MDLSDFNLRLNIVKGPSNTSADALLTSILQLRPKNAPLDWQFMALVPLRLGPCRHGFHRLAETATGLNLLETPERGFLIRYLPGYRLGGGGSSPMI